MAFRRLCRRGKHTIGFKSRRTSQGGQGAMAARCREILKAILGFWPTSIRNEARLGTTTGSPTPCIPARAKTWTRLSTQPKHAKLCHTGKVPATVTLTGRTGSTSKLLGERELQGQASIDIFFNIHHPQHPIAPRPQNPLFRTSASRPAVVPERFAPSTRASGSLQPRWRPSR